MIHYQENTAPHHHILTTHQITDTITNTNNDYASQGTDIIKKHSTNMMDSYVTCWQEPS